jgi:hypothetical protein
MADTKLVPLEPTPEMVKAYKNAMHDMIREARANGTDKRWPKRKRGYGITEREKCFCRWQAMLNAAPKEQS